jgi:hypothetical protein
MRSWTNLATLRSLVTTSRSRTGFAGFWMASRYFLQPVVHGPDREAAQRLAQRGRIVEAAAGAGLELGVLRGTAPVVRAVSRESCTVVNNTRFIHSRLAFTDSARPVLVRMGGLASESVGRSFRAGG